MTTNSLTDRSLRALLRPKPAPVAIFDTDVKQLQVRASVTGTVAFSVLKRPPRSRKLARFPVGTYPLITLAEARVKARAILREIEGGVDPRVRALEETRLATAAQASTFAAVAESFIARHVRTKRSARSIERLIRRTLIPRWSERPIAAITRADVIALIDEIVDRGHPEAAHTTLAYARRLFAWAVPRYDLEHAPTDHVRAVDLIGVRAVRKRVLDAREIALVWRAAEGMEMGAYVRLLLLLGVRRSCARASWAVRFRAPARACLTGSTTPPSRRRSTPGSRRSTGARRCRGGPGTTAAEPSAPASQPSASARTSPSCASRTDRRGWRGSTTSTASTARSATRSRSGSATCWASSRRRRTT
jgi:hypothetical protein